MAEIRPVWLGATATSRVLSSRGCRLVGFAVEETTGTAGAAVTIHDGGSVEGAGVVPVHLAANESAREWWWPGLDLDGGCYLEVVSGSVTGAVFLSDGEGPALLVAVSG